LIWIDAGLEARDVLSKTSLPVKTLAQIWYVFVMPYRMYCCQFWDKYFSVCNTCI